MTVRLRRSARSERDDSSPEGRRAGRGFVAALIGAAVAFAVSAPIAGAAPWTGSGTASATGDSRTPTITVVSDGTTAPAKFHYDFVENPPSGPGINATGSFEFSTTASATGPVTLDWHYTGHHSFFRVQVGLTAFVNRSSSDVETATLVSAGPTDCCTEPSGGFSYSGRVTLTDVQAGDTYGFRMTGSNLDLNASLEGTLALAWVVDKTDDSSGGACLTDVALDCSLRSAIAKANATDYEDRIIFDIPGIGVQTISPTSALPQITPANASGTDAVEIDGTTQPGFILGLGPVIELDGTNAGSLVHGLDFGAGSEGSAVRGLAINRFSWAGINAGSATTIAGNYIGTDPTGLIARPNGQMGVLLSATGSTVGGTDPADRNLISGNTTGIYASGSSVGANILGNYIGTDASGNADLGNTADGIFFDAGSSTVVGGTAAGARNVISGNGFNGIRIQAVGSNIILGNYFGVGADGSTAVGNSGNGIQIGLGDNLAAASNNTIGATDPTAGNVIANNGADGISVRAGTQNRISGNTIYSNGPGVNTGTLGIDLMNEGVTANDAGDGDTGAFAPNELQNFPNLAAAESSAASTTVTGTLDAPPGSYRLEFFSNAACDASGHGEGRTFLGWIDHVVSSGPGGGDFEFDTADGSGIVVPVNDVVTATATDSADNTSEFSACETVTATQTFVVNSTNDPGTGVCDASECTLREAISAANAAAGVDEIHFDIDGLQTIQPNSPLPAILETVTIDGTTDPDFAGDPIIELAGNFAEGASGLVVDGASANGTTIRGLVVNQFGDGSGIVVRNGADTVTIQGNYVGTDTSGNYPFGNGTSGVVVEAGSNGTVIGGNDAAESNVISGNSLHGIVDDGTATRIQGNYIGTNADSITGLGNAQRGVQANGNGTEIGGAEGDGNVISANGTMGIFVRDALDVEIKENIIGLDADAANALGNGSAGVQIEGSSTNVQVGGDGNGNVISANDTGVAVYMAGTSNVDVWGNLIGTDVTGELARGNTFVGIDLDLGATDVEIGSPVEGNGNVISANGQGIEISGGASATIERNYIGTDDDGTSDLGNTLAGVFVNSSAPTTIGGSSQLDHRNVISGNGSGINIAGSNLNVIQTNYIGTDVTGTADLGNSGAGISIVDSVGTTIGGVPDSQVGQPPGNLVSGNGGIGILINGSASTGNSLTNNLVGTNAAGTAAIGNGGGGVVIDDGSQNTIGQTGGNSYNLISGNSPLPGVRISGSAATQNSLAGNRIGTTLDGESELPNGNGVEIGSSASDNDVGVPASDARQVISGNDFEGVSIQTSASSNHVTGNFIGLDIDGDDPVPNDIGVRLDGGAGNEVGGTGIADRNVISANDDAGVLISSDGNTVLRNYIGIDEGGETDRGNGIDGIRIPSGENNVIGLGNLISGNDSNGIEIASCSNQVVGNSIGQSSEGDSPIPNNVGVSILGTACSNEIGGSGDGANVISGNTDAGIVISADDGEGNGQIVTNNLIGPGSAGPSVDLGSGTGIRIANSSANDIDGNVIGYNGTGIVLTGAGSFNNSLQHNRIGTDGGAGDLDLGNDDEGISIVSGAHDNHIGGLTTDSDQNVISANGGAGIEIAGDDNLVTGVLIGTTADGMDALGNGEAGIVISGSDNTVGGFEEGNFVSANGTAGLFPGIEISGDFNTVQGNVVGGNRFLQDIGNSAAGIKLTGTAQTNLIGGESDPVCEGHCNGEGNVVVFNGPPGGIVHDGSAGGNTYTHNLVYSNAGLGIDLGATGVTANDLNDADSGANDLQNFPVITSAEVNSSEDTVIEGTIDRMFGGGALVLEFFSNTECDGSGNGEGEQFLGSLTMPSGPAETFTFTYDPAPLAEGTPITATATNSDGSTSEFSACFEVEAGGSPAEATIELESDDATVIAGAQSVPTGGIDTTDLTRSDASTQATPLDSIPLDSIDIDATPLESIPLDSIGLTSQLLNQVLGGVHLSDIPLSTPGGWPAKLAGTPLAGVALNTITLADVYALNEAPGPDAVPLDSIPLDSIDLSKTPLDSIGLGAIALGAVPLDSIPLDSIGPNNEAENAADWCDLINPPDPQVRGYTCSLTGSPPTINPTVETLIGVAVRGVPLDSIPLDSIPLDSIPLDSIPLDSIPLDSIPLDSISTVGSPLDSIPLDSIDFAASPLDSIPLDSIGPGIVDCSTPGTFNCAGKNLGQADAAGKIIAGVTLGQLIEALQAGHGATVADLIYGLPPGFTLGDLFALLLGQDAAYDWSRLDLNTFPINEHSPDGGVITYHAVFEITGGSPTTTATVHASLPDGARYKSDSSTLRFSEGPAAPIDDPTITPSQLEWVLTNVQEGEEYELTWQVHAPIRLGNYDVSANVVVPGMDAPATSQLVPVEVIQTLEPNDALGAGATLVGDTLYLGYMLQGDVDRHIVPIPAAFGSRVQIKLSHISPGTDLDLTVSGPAPPQLRTAPSGTIPLQNAQLDDTKLDLDARTQALPPETLQDVPTTAITVGSRVIRASSDNRGNADEEVTLVSQGETGQYVVQVSDYEGDSPMPYMLEVGVTPPANPGCAARTFPFAGQGVAGTMPTIPANVNTLILVNRKRLGDTYGTAGMNNVMTRLNQLAGRSDLGIVGAVIPVESNAAVASAYGAWDTNPCSIQAANNVVRAIGQLVDTIEPDNLQYKVIVGGDDQIPFGRVPDETRIANESTYADSLGPNANQYKAALASGFLLTDDVWAEEAAPRLFGHELLVPDQAVGRLVETPGEITGMIDAFLAVNGAMTPARSLTTGYDFLTDGANAVNAPFQAAYGANARTLINDTWVAKDPPTGPGVTNDLEDALFPTTPTLPPQLAALNAHFDHTRLLPAAENTANRAANLYTSLDVRNRGASAVAQRVLFSMGCHSGLATADTIYSPTDPLSRDWAQTFLAGGAFAWIGNTGFGLGDTVEVAYTERLHALFSGNLDGSLSLGEALAQAKQEYLSALGIVAGYDAKVVMQTTLYGLPMLDIGTGAPPATPAPLPLQTDAATGLQAAAFTQNPTFTPVTVAGIGKFYRAQTTQVTNRRPLEPLVSFDITQPGRIAHGIMITSLASPPDELNFDGAFSRVLDDVKEPEIVGEVSHPAKIQSISTFSSFASPATVKQNAVLIPGLYRSDGTPDPSGIGIHRLYNQVGGHVLYALPSETDFTPPQLGPLETTKIGNSVGFAVDVTDADGIVKDVKVIYRDCSGTWRLSTLQPSGSRWSGGGALATTCTTNQIDYYLQAADDAGNVAVSSLKVQIESLALPAPTGPTTIAFSLAGPLHASGWYTGNVVVTISSTPASPLEYSLDGAAFQAYSGPFTVTTDGVHIVEARADDESTNSRAFAIDKTNPVVLMTTPPPGASYPLGQVVKANYTCADSGSGIATCNGTPANGANLNTNLPLGTKTITVTATDRVGRTTNFSRNYQVVLRNVLFASSRTGFGDIYSISPSGGIPAQLTTGNSIDAEPEWFPGNQKIAFSSSRTGNGDIYVMNADGSNVTRLTTTSDIDTSPAVSPDGSKIAFASRRGGNWDIYVMNANGTSVLRRTTNSAEDLLPTWNSTGAGTQIAFFSNRTGNGDIYTMNADGTSQLRRTTSSGVDTEPAWFGSTIAFSTNRHGDNNFEIYTMTSTGGSQTRRTSVAGHDVTPAWSGDGTKLAFATNRSPGGGFNFNIWTMNATGTPNATGQAALVTHGAADLFPDW